MINKNNSIDVLGLNINTTYLRAKPTKLLLCIGTAPMSVLGKYTDLDTSYVSVLMKKFLNMKLIYRVDTPIKYALTDKGVKVKEYLLLLLTASNENKC